MSAYSDIIYIGILQVYLPNALSFACGYKMMYIAQITISKTMGMHDNTDTARVHTPTRITRENQSGVGTCLRFQCGSNPLGSS